MAKKSKVANTILLVGILNEKFEGVGELTIKEFSRIRRVGDDFVIPVELAQKIKGVSKQAINYAIERGKLTRVSGVLLSSLGEYNIDKVAQKSGRLRVGPKPWAPKGKGKGSKVNGVKG